MLTREVTGCFRCVNICTFSTYIVGVILCSPSTRQGNASEEHVMASVCHKHVVVEALERIHIDSNEVAIVQEHLACDLNRREVEVPKV